MGLRMDPLENDDETSDHEGNGRARLGMYSESVPALDLYRPDTLSPDVLMDSSGKQTLWIAVCVCSHTVVPRGYPLNVGLSLSVEHLSADSGDLVVGFALVSRGPRCGFTTGSQCRMLNPPGMCFLVMIPYHLGGDWVPEDRRHAVYNFVLWRRGRGWGATGSDERGRAC